jgi:hypothetical protein
LSLYAKNENKTTNNARNECWCGADDVWYARMRVIVIFLKCLYPIESALNSSMPRCSYKRKKRNRIKLNHVSAVLPSPPCSVISPLLSSALSCVLSSSTKAKSNSETVTYCPLCCLSVLPSLVQSDLWTPHLPSTSSLPSIFSITNPPLVTSITIRITRDTCDCL